MDFQTAAKIEGEETQIATFTLQPNETIRAETGSLIYMTEGIEMETSSSFSDGMKRFMTGQNLFVTDFTYNGDPSKSGKVALGTAFPSKLLRLNLQEYPDQTIVAQKGAYVASNVGVTIEMAFTKNFQSGFFGGEGFVLQKMQGEGDVLLQAGGTLVRKDLDDGETLRVASGTLVAMTSTIDYDVQMLPGFNNVMFGGQGLFVTTLQGPGTIWLQGMPPDRMISEIARKVPGGGLGFGIPIGMGGGGGGDGGAADVEAADGAEGATDDAGGEDGDAGGGAEDMVAASDASIEADRQATVGTSGAMTDDADSPSALFGDAAPQDSTSTASNPDAGWSDPPPLTEEPTFQDDNTSFSDSSTPQDDTSLFGETDTTGDGSDSGDPWFGEEKFGDDSSFGSFGDGSGESGDGSDLFDGASSEEGQSAASSILSTLWDIFTGGDE